MKRAIASLLMFSYLFSATHFSELLKINLLLEHFQEHRIEDPSVSFMAFLEIHYLHGNAKDADFEKDMKLPFKTCNNIIQHFTSIMAQPIDLSIIVTTLTTPNRNIPNFYQRNFTSNFLESIWQPPKTR